MQFSHVTPYFFPPMKLPDWYTYDPATRDRWIIFRVLHYVP